MKYQSSILQQLTENLIPETLEEMKGLFWVCVLIFLCFQVVVVLHDLGLGQIATCLIASPIVLVLYVLMLLGTKLAARATKVIVLKYRKKNQEGIGESGHPFADINTSKE